jgi:hypothetical protein
LNPGKGPIFGPKIAVEKSLIMFTKIFPGVFHTTLGIGPGPLELGIFAAFCPDWEFQKIIILKHFCENALYFNKNMKISSLNSNILFLLQLFQHCTNIMPTMFHLQFL